jgi:hypothetical protein
MLYLHNEEKKKEKNKLLEKMISDDMRLENQIK